MRNANDGARIALVTGAARGMGQGHALRLAKKGHRVILVDRVASTETAELIEQAGGHSVEFVVNLADSKDVEAAAARALTEVGPVDILVNNAGVYWNKPFEEIDLDDWRKMMTVNLDAPFLLCRGLIPSMKERKYGRIVNISSNTVGLKIPGFAHYVASKMGLIGLTRALASEFGGHGITVNAIAPGFTKTPGTMDPARRGPNGATTEEEIAFLTKLQAIPRVGEIPDLTEAMSFLTSDEAAFITGQTIVVDGGLWRV